MRTLLTVLALTASVLMAPAVSHATATPSVSSKSQLDYSVLKTLPPHEQMAHFVSFAQHQLQNAPGHKDPKSFAIWAEKTVSGFTNTQKMTQIALGPIWRQANDAQRERLQTYTLRMLATSYASAATEAQNVRFDIRPLRTATAEGKLRAQMHTPGKPSTSVLFAFTTHPDGYIQIYDVELEGVSLVQSIKQGFTQIVAQKGIDGLLQELSVKYD